MNAGLMLAFIVALFGVFPAPAFGGNAGGDVTQTDLYKRIDSAWQKGKIGGINKMMKDGGVHRFEDRRIMSRWARNNFIYTVNRNPHIGLLYAEMLGVMADEYRRTRNLGEYRAGVRTGLESFLASQLIAFEDIARCDDSTVGESYLQPWMSGDIYERYKGVLAGLDEKARNDVWSKAAEIANTRNLNRRDRALCATGAGATARAQVARDCRYDEDAGREVCDTEEHVKFVDDEAWAQSRLRVQDAMKGRVQEGRL